MTVDFTMKRIVLIEDDLYLIKNIKLLLEKNGFNVISGRNLKEGKHIIERENASLYLFDIMFTDGSGFELCQYARQKSKNPILFISAKDDENTIVAGLEMGADDYMTKPFRPNEFISRIKANLRRSNIWNYTKVYSSGNLVMDTDKRKEYKNDIEIFVQNIEYKLLEVFITNPEIVIRRERLFELIWDNEENFIENNSLNTKIRRKRHIFCCQSIKKLYKRSK